MSETPVAASNPPFASVLLRTQGLRPTCLTEALDSLRAQTVDDFEVLLLIHGSAHRAEALAAAQPGSLGRRLRVIEVAEGGRAHPLNVGMDAARGRYLTFLDDDDLVTRRWVERFRDGAAQAPDALIRSLTVVRSIVGPPAGGAGAPDRVASEGVPHFSSRFDLLEHLVANQTPICSIAVPLARARALGVRFDEALAVTEDWDFLLRLTLLIPVHDTEAVTSVYQQWEDEHASRALPREIWNAARASILAKLDEAPLRLPVGVGSRIVRALESAATADQVTKRYQASQAEVEALQRSLAELRGRYAAIVDSRSWRALTPLHRLWNLIRARIDSPRRRS